MVLFKGTPNDENAMFDAVAVGLDGVYMRKKANLKLGGPLSFDWMALEA